MRNAFETTMFTAGKKMGITAMEAFHCLIALLGVLLAGAFVFVALTTLPFDNSDENTSTSGSITNTVTTQMAHK